MSNDQLNEGQLVFDLVFGEGERPRPNAPEPSLLPQLAAFLCHDFSIEEVLRVALKFGLRDWDMPAWPALWYATLWATGSRPELVEFSRQFTSLPPILLDLATLENKPDPTRARALFDAALPNDLGPEFAPHAAAAHLLPYLLESDIERVIDDARFQPLRLDPGSLRSIVLAMQRIGRQPASAWIHEAIEAPGGVFGRFGRLSLLLPHLPDGARDRFADELASMAGHHQFPPYFRALVVSRTAPFVSGAQAFHRDQLLADLLPVWATHIESLLSAPWPTVPWGDVFRAHPEGDVFREVLRPHEVTEVAAGQIDNVWSTEMAMTSAPERGVPRSGPSEAPPPPSPAPSPVSPPSAAQDTPRALQADITLEDEMEPVSAFVKDRTHLLDVSIGRGGRIRADVGIDESVFDDTDQKSLLLPVFVRVGNQTLDGSIRLPRDQKRNSTVASFTVTAPSTGRVTARIHVMRPGGGSLLQSAMLIGDVVDSLAAAQAPATPMELQVDLLAGDLSDPQDAADSASVIADADHSQVVSDGVMVDLDVGQLQKHLGDLVAQIELAASRRDVDDTIIERKLVELAMSGQALRAHIDGPLAAIKDKSTLQVASIRPGDVLPLELVYDGPRLGSGSQICPNWRVALRAGSCDGCPGHGPDSDAEPRRVCPMRFWSMQKVIERRTADASGGQLRIGSEPSRRRPQLRAITSVVVGASSRVAADQVGDLRDHVAATFDVPARHAHDWAQWRDIIAQAAPEVLLAMPHDQPVASALTSALMMGEPDDSQPAPPSTELLSGSVSTREVHGGDARPGPIVMLLGCNTLFMQGRLTNFANEFHQQGAALTIATLGKLVADQAPAAARAILDRLAAPPDGATTLGEVMRQARRDLLSDNMIMALLLVANGDAQWQLPSDHN